MVKLEVGKSYKTECGRCIYVLEREPLDGTTLEYRCSDNFYRDENGKAFPIDTFNAFAHTSIYDVKEQW
jgi:hypothetical protein